MNLPRNVAASVRQRLRNLAHKQQESFQGLLTRYALERLLYRLSQSQHRDHFILKGAMLFSVWSNEPHRATRDMDLLGHGENTVFHLEQVFREICCLQVENDGLEFKEDTVRGQRITEEQEYEGVRINLRVLFAGTNTRIDLQVDIGFGDAVIPAPVLVEFPTLLDFPAPRPRIYTRETALAEKFQAMVKLGIANSRMKDFYDVWFLSQEFQFEGEALCRALKATFYRRKTALPVEPPLALTTEFSEDLDKQKQWKAFLKTKDVRAKQKLLSEVIPILQGFLMPPSQAIASCEPFEKIWYPTGPWQSNTHLYM